ncbi:MAG: aminopeptidase P family protein [Dehalococcoidales bacterium]|nr:aminopeptidase P family protein [Dehalococcoidales bacterium]
MTSVKKRLGKLRQNLIERGLDGIFVAHPKNRYYLSGFDGSAGYLLITQEDAIVATDFRYIEEVKVVAPDYRVFRITGSTLDWFPRLIAEVDLNRLGFEAEGVTFNLYRKLSQGLKKVRPQLEFVPVEGLVESLRVIKEPEEIKLITEAAEITDKAFEYIEGIIHPGMTEKEVAWELEKFHREQGSQPLPFEIIVASGPNAALPHARPSRRQIGSGEPVVIDMGARVGGYGSDLSRTLCLGEPDKTFKKVYDIVLRAQLSAIDSIREGMSGEEADNLARRVIEEAGYAEAFGHSLGHGVGLAPHEAPRLSRNSAESLSAGMVFTIEPGIYLVGWGGVRIEDLVLMTEDGVKVLSKGRK